MFPLSIRWSSVLWPCNGGDFVLRPLSVLESLLYHTRGIMPMLVLDAQQQPVVDHAGGDLLVIAGAGSGKTLAITARTAERIRAGAEPGRTLMTTFTNKAAREMRIRLAAMLGVPDSDQDLPFVGTQHGFGMRLIRRYREDLALGPFSLMDTDDAQRQQKILLTEFDIPKEDHGDYLRCLEWLTNEGVMPCSPLWKSAPDKEPIPDLTGLAKRPPEWEYVDAKIVHAVRARYARWKHQQGVLDLDDLLILPLMLVTENTAIRNRLAEYLDEIVIDESQDLNGAQYRFWRLLADSPDAPRLVLVGDDDQAIYRWRDAQPHFLRRFAESDSTTTLRMENNYRSHAAIVEHAGALIAHNRDRLDKTPRATRAERGDILFMRHEDESVLGATIARQILARQTEQPHAQIAILYRTHRLRALVEPELIRARIVYQVKDGTAFLDRAEPRLVLAIARLAANPKDTSALRRIAPLLGGVGDKAVDTLCSVPEGTLSPVAIAALSGKGRKALQEFVDRLTDLRANGPKTLAQWLADYAPFWAYTEKLVRRSVHAAVTRDITGEKASEESVRVQVALRESRERVLQTIGYMVDIVNESRDGVSAWEEALSIQQAGAPETSHESGAGAHPPVVVGTIHGAKGLEWDDVHIVGWSEGLLPLTDSQGGIQDLEEERCLAYVALTRGKQRVVTHHTPHISIPGMNHLTFQPSRFTREGALPIASRPQQPVRRPDLPAGDRRRPWDNPRSPR